MRSSERAGTARSVCGTRPANGCSELQLTKVFNLVPGFPLDGGRILRAALWKWKGTLGQATYIASRVGVSFAFALMALGVLQIFGGAVLGGFWFIIIGMFLRGAADAS